MMGSRLSAAIHPRPTPVHMALKTSTPVMSVPSAPRA